MHTTKNFLPLALGFTVLLSNVIVLNALDWPSEDGVISGNFGLNDRGRPLTGIIFSAEGEVEASGQGEILFKGNSANGPSRLPSPLGEWTALDHGDGIISIYSRMEKEETPLDRTLLEEKTVLGTSGLSGWSSSRGFYFFLFDRKERRWINPFLIVNPKADERPPVIQSVRLRSREDETLLIDPSVTRVLSQGLYTVTVYAYDTMLSADENPLAPFRILCSINGVETGVLNFETYSARDGSLMVLRNGFVPVREVFSPYPGWEAGEIRLTRGQATMEIIVQDFSGNTRNVLYRLQIE